jgi:Flp pilus assembly pilin Flp
MDWGSWGNAIRAERGQTAVEYAIVVALTVVILAIFLAVMPDDLFDQFWSFLTSSL